MRVLALDLSTSIGWAVLEGDTPPPGGFGWGLDEHPKLADFGTVQTAKPILAYGEYPWCYLQFSEALAEHVGTLVIEHRPNLVVIEESNLGKSRYAQKALEFIHSAVLRRIVHLKIFPVKYVSSSAWRKALNLVLSAEDKRANSRLSKAKRRARDMNSKLDKKSLGIRGRISKKHLSVRYVNEHYFQDLKMKDDDIADAVCLGTSVFYGAETCTGE